MTLGIGVALLLAAVLGPAAPLLTARMHPSWASWTLVTTSVLLALASTFALALPALAGLSTLAVVAQLGHWSVPVVREADVVFPGVDIAAGVTLVVLLASAIVVAVRRGRQVASAFQACREADSDVSLVVLDDDRPIAHAVPGRPGRIVASTGMLRALEGPERRALIAHERAHLSRRHYLFVVVTDIAAALNPFLIPLRSATRFAVERWADETAAERVGDRTVVARAVGKAALQSRGWPRSAVELAATAGPVPRRVAALLATAPDRDPVRVLASGVGLAVLIAAIVLAAGGIGDAAFDLHQVIEAAQTR